MLTKPELFKGTVMSNLDEMNVYTKDGQPVDNEQLNKVKVSDAEGDVNVAGVFVNWTHDDAHDVDEINMAMTGDMIIRIAQGTTVQRGDLLMSAGNGTAKPQGDDIVRSKTIAKVTSTHVTCTYADGSYCVPCVLMAC
jgi:formylmethanofuran dehydrogenase subunit A